MIPATACAVPLLAVATGTASARSVTTIPQLSGFHQMVVDTSVSPGYIFMAGSDSIVVTDLGGNTMTTLAGGDGVEALALSPDGSTLYAALTAGADADSIAAISVLPTPALTATYPLGAGNVPYGLAVQSGKVWVSYSDGADSGAIGAVDLTAATFEPGAANSSWASPPDLAADPSDTGVLVAVQPDTTAAMAETFSTTADSDSAAQLSAQEILGAAGSTCSSEHQLAVLPGGSAFIAACGSPQNEEEYSTADLSPAREYDTGSSPPAGVAVDADGLVAVGTSGSPSAIYVYGSDGSLLNILTVASPDSLVGANGLAWEDMATGPPRLAALTQPFSGDQAYSLDVFGQPAVTASAITVTGPSSAYAGRRLSLTGTLAFGTGIPPASTTLQVTRTMSGSATSRKLPSVSTGPGGTFSLTDTPTSTGTYTYAFSYAGSPATLPASANRRVSIVRAPTSLTLATGGTNFSYGSVIHLTARLGSTFRDRTVSLYARPIGSEGKRLLKTGTVNSSGELTVSYRAARSTRFSAVFGGDPQDTPKTVTRAAYIRARVSAAIKGYYAGKRIDGVLYRLFRSGAVLDATGDVVPDKHGECVRFEVQEFYQGAWKPNVWTPCVTLSKSSRAAQAFGLNQADIGYHYRIRAHYIPSAADKANLSAESTWLYLIVKT